MGVREVARRYLDRGMSVLPVDAKSKKPLTPSWVQYQKDRMDPGEVDRLFPEGAGVGVITGEISDLFVLDIDCHKHPQALTGLRKVFPNLLEMTLMTKTQHGGYHLWFFHPGSTVSGSEYTRKLPPGLDVRCDGNYILAPPTPGYQWITKHHKEPQTLPEDLLDWIELQGQGQQKKAAPGASQVQEGARNDTLFNLAVKLRDGGLTLGEVMSIGMTFGKGCGLKAGEVRTTVESAFEAPPVERNINQEVRTWALSTVDRFTTAGMYAELGLTSRAQKQAAMKALQRLERDNLVSRYGSQRGHYRVVSTKKKVIDFINAGDVEGADLWLPLDLHMRGDLPPGSLILVAGETNTGKTAFMLSTAWHNLGKMPVTYIGSSSETNARTLKRRILSFGHGLEPWKQMKALEQPFDQQDVVDPNGLNLIDYLEIHREFWEISERLKLIHDAMEDGIVIVAIQKNKKSSYGLGGEMSLHKAALGITLEEGNLEKGQPHTCRIQKVKYPKVQGANIPIQFCFEERGTVFARHWKSQDKKTPVPGGEIEVPF